MENNNLKLSLFDVTDLNNPTEIANYVVEGNYTSSTALNDPKALLFDLQKQLLVLPVSIDNYYYNVTLGSGTGSSNGSGGSIASPPSAAPAPQPGVIISSQLQRILARSMRLQPQLKQRIHFERNRDTPKLNVAG